MIGCTVFATKVSLWAASAGRDGWTGPGFSRARRFADGRLPLQGQHLLR